jgi:hypothetical protein
MAGKSNLAKHRKISMVQPPPSKPLPSLTLEEILKLAGNNRAYTVIESHGHIWKVHFEGDTKPSLVDMEDGKPVIEQIE